MDILKPVALQKNGNADDRALFQIKISIFHWI